MTATISTTFPEIPDDPEKAMRVVSQYMEDLQEQSEQRLMQDYTLRSMAWLTLPPAWTYPLAEACKFPLPKGMELRGFVQHMIRRRTAKETRPVRGEPGFCATSEGRQQVLRALRNERLDVKYLQKITQSLKKNISAKDDSSQALERWLDLAMDLLNDSQSRDAKYLDSDSDKIIQKVQQAIDLNRTGEALAWVHAGESVAEITLPKSHFRSSVRLAGRRLELAYRRFEDGLYLTNFMPREEQIQAFRKLLENDDQWALHYLGMGGVGKTMLLRHIIAVLAKEHHCSISRVDFDFISPDYPLRRPGQLLLELGDDLKLHSESTRAESVYERFRIRLQGLNDILDGEPPADDPLANINRPEFEDALIAFADFVQELPMPVILVLDTCEELSKLHPDVGHQPGVEATFQIVERLHERVSGLRIVFAGRRALARAGHDWKATGNVHLTEARDYLSLHQIRGFTDREAYTFLSEYKKLSLPLELTKAILKRSRAYASERRILFRDAYDGENGQAHRYNPFDLDLYADWAQDDPDLSAAIIAGGETDPYVEMRIIYRIKHLDVQRSLPIVVLLRRFEETLFRKLTGLEGDVATAVFKELRQQEWISVQTDKDLDTEFLTVDRHLQDRLDRYFEPRIPASDRKHIGVMLSEYVQETNLRRLSFSYIDAALRILPPRAGVALWWQISDRIIAQADWVWAEKVTELLMQAVVHEASENAVEPAVNTAIRATLIFALRHSKPQRNPVDLWKKIEASVEQDQDLPRFGALRLRALLGQIAAQGKFSQSLAWEKMEELDKFGVNVADTLDIDSDGFSDRAVQLLGSLASAAEGVVWALERNGGRNTEIEVARQFIHRVDAVFSSLDEELNTLQTGNIDFSYTPLPKIARYFLDFLRGRFELLSGDYKARESFTGDLPGKLVQLPSAHAWEDLSLPRSFIDHRRLLILISRQGRGRTGTKQIGTWAQEATKRLQYRDARFTLSLLLQKKLAEGPLPALDELRYFRDTLQKNPKETTGKHSNEDQRAPFYAALPPLWCSLAEAFAAIGQYTEASDVLFKTISDDQGQDRDQPDLGFGLRVGLKIAARTRSAELFNQLNNHLSQVLDQALLETIRSAFLVDANLTPDFEQDAYVGSITHARWQTNQILTDSRERVLEGKIKLNAERGGVIQCTAAQARAIILDQVEANSIMGFMEFLKLETEVVPFTTLREAAVKYSPHNFSVHLCEEQDLEERNQIRARFLDVDKSANHKLATLRHAQILLEEGELLLHRLPTMAAAMLDEAVDLFTSSESYAQALQATLLVTLAHIHAGQHEKAETIFNTALVASYEKLAADDKSRYWPKWRKLIDFGFEEAKYKPDLDNSSVQDFYALFNTIARLQHWFAIPADDLDRQRKLLETKEFEFRNLPELDFRHLLIKTEEGVARPDDVRISSSLKPKLLSGVPWANLLRVAGGIITFAIGIGVWVAMYHSFWWAGDQIRPGSEALGVGWRIGIFLAAAVLLAMVGSLLFKRMGIVYSKLVARLQFTIHVETIAASSSKEPQTIRLRARSALNALTHHSTVRLLYRLLFAKKGTQDYKFAPIVPPAFTDSYDAGMINRWPNDLTDFILQLNQVISHGQFSIPIDNATDPMLAPLSLEAILLAPVAGHEQGLVDSPLVFWRRYNHDLWSNRNIYRLNWSRRISSIVQKNNPQVMLKMPAEWQEQTRLLWQQAGWRADAVKPDAIHLIGNPVMTRAGLRMNLGNWRDFPKESSKMSESSMADTNEISAKDIVSSSAQLIIIQLAPSSSTQRGESDRKELALLRQFCDSLMKSGAAMVIMLPALNQNHLHKAFVKALRKLGMNHDQQLPGGRLFDFAITLRKQLLINKNEESSEWTVDEWMAYNETAADIALFINEGTI